jgi:hypothetical protein
MRWVDQMGGVLLEYAHPQRNQLFPTIKDHFSKLVDHAPKQAIATGLAAVFRAEDTPAFAQMVVDLFEHSDALRRAGVLTVLVPYVSQESQNVLADGGLFGFPPGPMRVLPDRMMDVSPEAVFLLATEAERRHRSGTIAVVSAFYAEHPAVLRHLGAHTLSLIMTSIANSL